MTIQELSTIIRQQLNVLIILINNGGYTFKRCIHGSDKSYNDIAPWRYSQAPTFFGASEGHVEKWQVRTWSELRRVLETVAVTGKPMLKMTEVFMDPEDAPATLLSGLQEQKEKEQV